MKYLLFSLALFLSVPMAAQEKLTPKDKRDAIEELARLLREEYIELAIGEEMSDALERNIRSGKYKQIRDYQAFADTLTRQLFDICQDQHLHVYATENIMDVYARDASKETERYYYTYDKDQNFGFSRVEHLPGNIGYVEFDDYSAWEEGLKSAMAAFHFLRHTDAILVDLRSNSGGSPEMYQNIASLFFERKSKVEFSSIYFRAANTTQRLRAQRKLKSFRLPEKPLYFLIGPQTVSAAEAMAYDFKQLGRAVLVGDTTKGAANPAQTFALGGDFRVSIPIGKAINPITGTNWEGVGVAPDSLIAAEHALTKAYLMALKQASSEVEYLEYQRKQWIEVQQLTLYNVGVSQDSLSQFVGNYEGREVRMWAGRLHYRNATKRQDFLPLWATPEGTFAFESKLQFPSELPQLQFGVDEEGSRYCEVIFVSGNRKRLMID